MYVLVTGVYRFVRNPMISGYVATGGHIVLLGMLSYVTNPFMIGPAPAVILISVLAAHPLFVQTWILAAIAAVATLLPLVVRTGVATFTDHAAVLDTLATSFKTEGAFATLVLYTIALIALATAVGRSQDDERRRDRRMLQVQSWQLRQLLPAGRSQLGI